MKQHDLNQAVAQVTGESAETIAAMGFSLLRSAPSVRIDYRALARKFQPKRMNTRDRRPPERRWRPKAAPITKPHPVVPDTPPENHDTQAA